MKLNFNFFAKLCLAVMTGVVVCALKGAEPAAVQSAKSAFDSVIDDYRQSDLRGEGIPLDAARRFNEIIKAAPDSEEATAARVWQLAIAIEHAQTNAAPGVRAACKALQLEIEKAYRTNDVSWAAKLARMIRVGALLLEEDWPLCDQGVEEILKDIRSYTEETNRRYVEFLELHGKSPKEMEPELNFLRVIAYSVRGDLKRAIAVAQDIQTRFPEWSKKERIDSTISQLEEGVCPFRLH